MSLISVFKKKEKIIYLAVQILVVAHGAFSLLLMHVGSSSLTRD